MADDKLLSDEEIFLSDDKPEEIEQTPEPSQETETPVEAAPEPEVPEETQPEPVAEVVEEQPAPEPVQEPQEASVPSWRLREINEAKAATERQLAEAQQQSQMLRSQLEQIQRDNAAKQQQQPAPDMYADPEGYQAYQVNQFQSRDEQIAALQHQTQMNMARIEAMTLHGAKEVQTAWDAALVAEKTDPTLTMRISNSPNPWAEAVKWHGEVETQKALGEGGIEGFRQREREALMQDPEFRKSVFESMRAEAGGGTVAEKPTDVPSLNGAPRVSTPENGDPLISDAELFNMR